MITKSYLEERIELLNNVFGTNYTLAKVKTDRVYYGIRKPNGSLLSKNYYTASELNCFINGCITMENECGLLNKK